MTASTPSPEKEVCASSCAPIRARPGVQAVSLTANLRWRNSRRETKPGSACLYIRALAAVT